MLLCWLKADETKRKRSKKAYPNLPTIRVVCFEALWTKNWSIEK
jgi:hypothetical protein